MQVSVIKIGNSKGIRLSKTLLEKYKIRETVNLVLKKHHMILKPLSKPRNGWDKAFKEMAVRGDDKLPDYEVFEDENLIEWI